MRSGPVRTRAALGATAVVAVALVAAGIALLAVLRGGLADNARLEAETAAREVAAQVTDTTARAAGDADGLDEDTPVQVVDAGGRVLGASEPVRGEGPIASFHRPPERPGDDDEDDGPVRIDRDTETETLALPADEDGEAAGRGEDAAGTQEFEVAAVQSVTSDGVPVTVYAGASLREQQDTVGGLARAMLAGLPLMLLVVAGVTWLVTRRALRPVEGIRSEMAAITASEDLSRRVPQPHSRDEIARLAATTNETLAALERSTARQRAFVADASHELRSPIASLRTQLEVGTAHPDLLDLDGAVQDTVRLQHLAADLLLLARLDSGERPAGERVSPAALVQEEVARRSGSTPPVRIAGEPDTSETVGSRGQLARVLGNLLDNAQRHASGAVTVAVRRAGGFVEVAVDDDGGGVPEGDRERIFERFVRLDDARARDDGGAGLGLAIARDVAVRHGGTLTAGDAPAPSGGGARFLLRLPLVAGDGGASPAG